MGLSARFIMVAAAAALLTSCGSAGGFGEMMGISNEGIDAENVETNAPLVQANGDTLPTPDGTNNNIQVAESGGNGFDLFGLFSGPAATEEPVVETVTVATTTETPKIIVPKIVAPAIVAPKVTNAVVIGKPVPRPDIIPVAKVEPKPEAKPEPKPEVKVAVVTKIEPKDYKFVDLFTFRSDMRAGKLANPLATAALISASNASCKLAGNKFTCGEYFITIE